MKIFVCEYITGGGLYREPLSESLAIEGRLMREALLGDLSELPEITVLTTHDVRFPPQRQVQSLPAVVDADVWQLWQDCMQQADAVWLIAPEINGVLAKLAAMAETLGKAIIGPGTAAIALASSKKRTLQALQQAGIPIVPMIPLSEAVSCAVEGIVVKPDDGAGCEATFCFKDKRQLAAWMATHADSHILQPYIPGRSGSISMLCRDGKAWLLSCNEQKAHLVPGDGGYAFKYQGGIINGFSCYWNELEVLAESIAQALPQLQGYIGVDFIVQEEGTPAFHVLEINPRLTTSYTGLAASIGYNPARYILDLFYNPEFTMPQLNRNPVEIFVHA